MILEVIHMTKTTLFVVIIFIKICFSSVQAETVNSVDFLNQGSNPNAPFSEAVRAGNTLYLAGKLGYIQAERRLASGGIKGETKQAMDNIKGTVEKYGYAMSDLIKCTAILADVDEWAAFNEVYTTYFEKGRYPARTAFAAKQLALNARIEVECIAYKE